MQKMQYMRQELPYLSHILLSKTLHRPGQMHKMLLLPRTMSQQRSEIENFVPWRHDIKEHEL